MGSGTEQRRSRRAGTGTAGCDDTAHDVQRTLREQGRALRKAVPEVYRAFGSLHAAAMGDGALPARTKELIALALSVQAGCDGCVAAHARAAARLGAGEEEVAEAIGVTVLMGGGPATVQGPRAFAAFRELSSDQATASAPVASPPTGPVPAHDAAPDRDLARLLHDLDVANDYHPDHPRWPLPDPGAD